MNVLLVQPTGRSLLKSTCTQKNTKRKKPKRSTTNEKWEAKRTAEAAANKLLILKTLQDISAVRQRVVEGKATQHQVTQAVNKATKVVVDSTNRIIRMCTEVRTSLTRRAFKSPTGSSDASLPTGFYIYPWENLFNI